jgi:hypothetical protein
MDASRSININFRGVVGIISRFREFYLGRLINKQLVMHNYFLERDCNYNPIMIVRYNYINTWLSERQSYHFDNRLRLAQNASN